MSRSKAKSNYNISLPKAILNLNNINYKSCLRAKKKTFTVFIFIVKKVILHYNILLIVQFEYN